MGDGGVRFIDTHILSSFWRKRKEYSQYGGHHVEPTQIRRVKRESKGSRWVKSNEERKKKRNICAIHMPSTFDTGAMALPCLARSGTGRVILRGVQLLSDGLVQGDFDALHQ